MRGLLGHEEVQLVGLSEQAWGGSRGGGGSSFADAQTSPAFFLLVTGKGALMGVSRGTTFVPRAYQGWSLGLLGEAHAVPVQPCPPGPGGSGQEALVWSAPAHKLPSPCPEGALTLLRLFSRHKVLTSCVPTAGGKAHPIWRPVLASGPLLTGRPRHLVMTA